MTLPDPLDFDLDDLDADEVPTGIGGNPLVLWLIVVSMVTLFVPLFLISRAIDQDSQRLGGELAQVQATLADVSTPPPEVVALRNNVAEVQQRIMGLESISSDIASDHINWPADMTLIGDYDASQLTLTGLTQNENRITLYGVAVDDAAVIAYARMLEDSGHFARVVVQSMKALGVTPTLTPTPAEVTPTATPTDKPAAGTSGDGSTASSGGADEYENDDELPKAIFLGQAQSHNFYPAHDVDNVVFLAKAGRSYRVTASNLAVGVDTVLIVTYGDVVITNDDSKAGALDSEIDFDAPDADTGVVIEVQNRGQTGPDMTYTLTVIEVVEEEESSSSSSSTTTNPTSPPTAAPPSSPTATPVPDPSDAYEDDDTSPAAIAVGETQSHNFYPSGDVDLASIVVKGGRQYQVTTSALAVGVDTYMTVTLGSDSWSNDDYLGTGDFSSRVCFPAAADGSAVVTTTNLALLYGGDRTYKIDVQEVTALGFSPSSVAFGTVTEGDTPSLALGVSGGSSEAWTAVADSSWFSIDSASGTTPSTINVTVAGGLTPGTYTGNITFTWQSLCQNSVPVSLEIVSASASAPRSGGLMSLAVPKIRVGAVRPLASSPQGGQVEFIILVELRPETP